MMNAGYSSCKALLAPQTLKNSDDMIRSGFRAGAYERCSSLRFNRKDFDHRIPTVLTMIDTLLNHIRLPTPLDMFPSTSVKYFKTIHVILMIFFLNTFNITLTVGDTMTYKCETNKEYKQDIIEPLVKVSKNADSRPSHDASEAFTILSTEVGCPARLRIHFSSSSDIFEVDLIKNSHLISDKYFKTIQSVENSRNKQSIAPNDDEFFKNHFFLNLHNFTSNDDHCHYHGLVNGNPASICALSIVNNRLLSGFLYDGLNTYYLHANTIDHTTILTKSDYLCNSKQDTQSNNSNLLEAYGAPKYHKTRNGGPQKQRSRRYAKIPRSATDNYIRHEPFRSNSSSLYVELLIVHDHSQFTEYKGNTTNIAERTMQIVNIMNAFYRQLNIFVVLVGVVLWVEKDEILLTEDGDSTLTNFLKYRYEKLLPKYHHDNAQLITSTSFNGSVVGKALKGPICTHEHSGGVNTDHSHSPAIVAVTLAHELGHNFGMEHDEDITCKCPDEKCIMSSSSSTVHPKHWSSCSIDYLEDSKRRGLLDCLTDQPRKAFGPICGNGFVEDGEDCDIGEPIPTYGTSKSRKAITRCNNGQHCDFTLVNPCCDRQTCKFVANATCAQGSCCDLSKCSIYKATELKVCRPRHTECDLEETCDGSSEYCPRDVYYHDGIECGPTVTSKGNPPAIGAAVYNKSRAYCYGGKCASYESQCQLLWGPSGSVAKDICFEQNVHGNISGNCGYDRKNKLYNTCEPEDSVCGMLHCVHSQPNIGDKPKTEPKHEKIFCHGAIIDAGLNVQDPGLVPNGAACGNDKMCLNQKCVPVDEVIYNNWCSSDCNGNGICDNLGICHCNDGTVGTSCYQFFGPNFHMSLFFYIVFFFVPMITLITFAINHYRKQIKIWWFLHNRKIVLRDKAREPNQQRRLAYDIDRNTISISEPIPLSRPGNTNQPFYQANSDPWAETTCETNKSPGYRLEPIKKEDTSAQKFTESTRTTMSNLKPIRTAPPPPVQSLNLQSAHMPNGVHSNH